MINGWFGWKTRYFRKHPYGSMIANFKPANTVLFVFGSRSFDFQCGEKSISCVAFLVPSSDLVLWVWSSLVAWLWSLSFSWSWILIVHYNYQYHYHFPSYYPCPSPFFLILFLSNLYSGGGFLVANSPCWMWQWWFSGWGPTLTPGVASQQS